MGYFSFRTIQQHGKEKHWYRLLSFSSPMLHEFTKEKGKGNNIYDGTCYFSPEGIDTGGVFARQVCLSKDKQSRLP